MSSSLDDMPTYEHFQDALDASVSEYPVSALDKIILHEWIEYITFSLCVSTPEGITMDIWKKYLGEDADKKFVLTAFIKHINQTKEFYLQFNHLL